MKYEDSPSSIRYYVKRFFIENKAKYSGKKFIDFPAGKGVTSQILHENGIEPVPIDLYPENFEFDKCECIKGNINYELPLEDSIADGMICQEGIEHFSDQHHAFKEFNRVIKKGGKLLVTTPNYSNLGSKLSYFLSESERYIRIMPPNEIDSIWINDAEDTSEIYYGHIFLIGIQKLRVLAKISGFDIVKIHFTKAKNTSSLLLPFFYPLIYFANWQAYKRNLRKAQKDEIEIKKKIYKEQFDLAVNPKILVDGHLFVEFQKTKELSEVAPSLVSFRDIASTL
jgi:SAM-dependent methyltransferase